MKKFIIIAIVFVIVLIGVIILLNVYSENSETGDIVSNNQLVEVYDFSTNELIIKYESQEEIDDFTKKLAVDNWSLGSPSSEDTEKYLIKMYKAPTKKLFRKNDDELKEVGTIIIYESGKYVSLNVDGKKVDFQTNTNLANIF